ncbi:MAG: dephospho-CoA kinase [Kingella sp. (in: b-proteobacteria)]|nr:MAG: dephospho-CoA kinase [Kingella sp. (in: b-proteobacteria)]
MTAWVGLTGGIGSGKSQAAACFALLGVPVIDADAVSRILTQTPDSEALRRIRQTFGYSVIDSAGCLNRAAMREYVFADERARQRLEAILHPLIYREIERQKAACTAAPYGIIELPTLAEHPVFRRLVQRVLLVQCDEKTRVQRVMARNGLTEAAVRAIMQAQAGDEQRLALADDCLVNQGSPEDLSQAVQRQHRIYLQRWSL